MTTLASEIISRVRYITNDQISEYRTTDEEILLWINDCVALLVSNLPALFVTTTDLILQAGYRQDVDAVTGAIAFKGIPGYPAADFDTLTRFRPNWMADTAGTLQNWTPSTDKPTEFYVYPPSPGNHTVSVSVVVKPALLTQATDTIQVPDNYVPAITQYCVGMVESKDDEHVNSNRAAQAKAEFVALIRGA